MWGYLYPDTDATGTVRGLANPTPRQANAVVHHQLSQSQGGIPSVDGDAGGLPAPLGLNPRDAELSSGKGVCLGASSRRRDGLGSGWAEHSPSAGVTTE